MGTVMSKFGTSFAGNNEWLPVSSAPASASATGRKGQYFIDATNGFLYVCVATNTWKRATLSSW